MSGCSYTFGQEIYDAVDDPSNLTPSKHAWPDVYADLAGYDNVVNVSIPGASNHYIVRSIINRATELLAKNIEFDIAVLWTYLSRHEYYYRNKFVKGIGSSTPDPITHVSKNILKHVSDMHYVNSFNSAFIFLTEFAQIQNVKFNWMHVDNHFTKVNGYRGVMGTEYFTNFLWGPGELDWQDNVCEKSIKYKCGPGGHPLEEGHAHAAHVLYDTWHNKTGEQHERIF